MFYVYSNFHLIDLNELFVCLMCKISFSFIIALKPHALMQMLSDRMNLKTNVKKCFGHIDPQIQKNRK